MMEKQEIAIELLYKKLNNTLSEEEEKRFDQWIQEADHRRYFEYIRSFNESKEAEKADSGEIDQAWMDFRKRVHRQKSRHYRLLRVAVVAASVILLLGILPLQFSKRTEIASLVVEKQIRPGQRNAILELANGQVYDLKELTGQNQGQITNHISVDSCRLNYTRPDSVGQYVLAYNKVIVPRGGEFQLVLEDGTKVWLTAESQLKYPEVFTGARREVFLEGEAYFEVAKDASHPFVLHTGQQKVTVLGTSFGVTGYAEESSVSATLVEGSVRVEFPGSTDEVYLLEPGYRISYDRRSCRVHKERVDVREYVAWKDGKYVFTRKRLEDMLATLSRWYDFQVFYQNTEVKEVLFSGELMRFENFNDILRLISRTSDVKFDVKQNIVRVMNNN